MVHTQIKYIMICDAHCKEYNITKNTIIHFQYFYEVAIYEMRDVIEFIFFKTDVNTYRIY